MKKIFLLATTAVFMTTANAWAADPVTVSVPALGVKAELTPLAAFTKTADLNFGGIVFDPSDLGSDDYVSFGAFNNGTDTPDFSGANAVKAHYGTPTRGKYTYTGSLNLNGGTFTIGGQDCVLNDVYTPNVGECQANDIALGENAKLDAAYVSCKASPDKECYFSGSLQVKGEYLEGLTSTATLNESLTITYNY